MKVCHFTSVHPYQDTRILLKECRTLAEAGYEVHLVAPDAPEGKNDQGVFLHSAPQAQGGRLSRMTKTMWGVVQKARSIQADVYHFHDPELLPAGLLLQWSGKKVIYDVHEDVPRDILTKMWIPAPGRRFIAKTFEIFENFAAKRLSYVLTATPFIKNRFAQFCPHVEVVNNYPLLHELQVSTDGDWATKEKAVTYVGSITEIRGIKEMVEGTMKSGGKLLLGGRFSPAELREQVSKLPGWACVEELGQLNRQEVAKTFARARGGLILLHPAPNHIDAQPNKMFEYMSAGIPLIGSHFPLWQDIIEGNSCGLCVDPLDPAAIGEAIGWIFDHPEEAEVMGQKGRDAVREKYNWEAEARSLLAVYKELEV